MSLWHRAGPHKRRPSPSRRRTHRPDVESGGCHTAASASRSTSKHIVTVLDTVPKYGNTVSPWSQISKENPHEQSARCTRCPLCRRPGRDSRVDLLTGSACPDRTGLQRRLDRQPHGPGAIPPGLSRRRPGRDVLRVSPHLHAAAGLQARRDLRDPPGAQHLQAHLLGRRRTDAGRARISRRRPLVLLIRSSP